MASTVAGRNQRWGLSRMVSRAPRISTWLIAMLAFDFLLVPLVEALDNNGPDDALAAFFIGGMVGQCAIVAILGGLYGTSWIDGFLTSGLYVIAGIVLFVLGVSTVENGPPNDFWAIFGCVPGVMFAVYAPMLIMRHFANWRLVEPGKVYPKQPADLGSIFLNTAVIAVILILLRIPQKVFGTPTPLEFWGWSISAGIVLVLISSAVTIPLAAYVVNCDSPTLRITRLIVSAIVAYGVFAVSLLVIGIAVGESLPADVFFFAALATFTATVAGQFGIWAVRRDGFRLRTSSNDLARLTSSTTEDQKAYERQYLAQHRKRMTLQVGAVVALTIGLNAYVAAEYSTSRRVQRAMGEIRRSIAKLGGRLRSEENGKLALSFSGVDSPDLFSCLITIRNSLMRTNVFDGLESLDLSNSGADDNGSYLWGNCRSLQLLDVSYSQVTGKSFGNNGGLYAKRLVAKGLPMARANWGGLNQGRLRELLLDASEVDVVEFADFMAGCKFRELSLNGVVPTKNSINEVDLVLEQVLVQDPQTIRRLRLAGWPVTDAYLRQLAVLQLRTLDLSATAITDDGIDWLLPPHHTLSDLRLAETKLTNDGVSKLKDIRLHVLNLAKTDVTGDAFRGWKVMPALLDLSDTKVGDELAHALFCDDAINSTEGAELHLRNTLVTDALLPKLARLNCRLIDISGTRITAKGLMKLAESTELPARANTLIWQVNKEQFTKAEFDGLTNAGLNLIKR